MSIGYCQTARQSPSLKSSERTSQRSILVLLSTLTIGKPTIPSPKTSYRTGDLMVTTFQSQFPQLATLVWRSKDYAIAPRGLGTLHYPHKMLRWVSLQSTVGAPKIPKNRQNQGPKWGSLDLKLLEVGSRNYPNQAEPVLRSQTIHMGTETFGVVGWSFLTQEFQGIRQWSMSVAFRPLSSGTRIYNRESSDTPGGVSLGNHQ